MSNQQPGGAPQTPDPQPGYPQPGSYVPPSSAGGSPQAYPQPDYPQQTYPQPQPGGQQAPYQIPNYAAQHPGYQAQAQAPYPAYGAPSAPPARSPMLGIIAFAVLLLCVVAGSVAGFQLMQAVGSVAAVIAQSSGSTIDEAVLTQALQDQLVSAYSLQMMVINATVPLGFAAWILGIVATATKRGRGWGVTTIILGVLAPIIGLVVSVMAMAPAIAAVTP